jgi:hypothetical protein
MLLTYESYQGTTVAEVMPRTAVLTDEAALLDLLAQAYVDEAVGILLHATQLDPAFFDLRTGIAGSLLQKAATYRIRLAIIGDFENVESNALRAFIIECNRGEQFAFCQDRASALQALVP